MHCIKLLSKVYMSQVTCCGSYLCCGKAHTYYDTHSPLIISASAGTRYFAAVAALSTCIVHHLNGLDTYTSCTVHEQDSVVARHEKTNYIRAISCMLYSM